MPALNYSNRLYDDCVNEIRIRSCSRAERMECGNGNGGIRKKKYIKTTEISRFAHTASKSTTLPVHFANKQAQRARARELVKPEITLSEAEDKLCCCD